MVGISQADFEEIFNTWYVPIRNFLYYKNGNINVAEDIAQDVFLKLWEKRKEVRSDTVKQLLYTIANNLFLNNIEHQKVSLKFAENYVIGNNNESPHFEMELKEFDKKLQNAINMLDDKRRTVFLMNRIEKFTYTQIAENLGITVKAVEKRMQKALSFLKEKVEVNI
jgi:RNA polymerase sigma-70 factor (ECF subfamily)